MLAPPSSIVTRHGSRQHVLLDPPAGLVGLGRPDLAQCGRRRTSKAGGARSVGVVGQHGQQEPRRRRRAAEDAHRRPGTATATGPASSRRARSGGSGGRRRTGSRSCAAGSGPLGASGSAGIGVGWVSDRRWVRFRTPVATRLDVPSGATSDRRTTHVATGIDVDSQSDDLGHAEDRDRLAKRLGRIREAAGLVRPEVAREAVRRPAGAPREAAGRARPSPGTRACRPPAAAAVAVATPATAPEAASAERHPRRASRRPGRGKASPRAIGRATPRGTAPAGPVALEPGQRRLPSQPFSTPRR